jgi:serine/threonine-protein kinase
MTEPFSPGTLVRDRYEVEALIGRGGMGAVFRVADRRLPGRLCALKAMRAPASDIVDGEAGAATRKQFLTEASTLARLDHPNLPKVSDYFGLEDYDCLVMDYVPGQDLNQRIADARRRHDFLPLSDVLGWIGQLCDVLEYLHSQQPPIIHGDVKPANIKLNREGVLKLVDFGLSHSGDPDDPRTLTGAGLRGLGSLPYAALEQYAGSRLSPDPRSDIYSLGATLYHLVTNQPPASAHDRFLDPASLTPPDKINHSLPAEVTAAVMAAMQPHPKDRPQSVRSWRASLPKGMPGSPPIAPGGEGMSAASASAWYEARWYLLGALVMVSMAVALTLLR